MIVDASKLSTQFYKKYVWKFEGFQVLALFISTNINIYKDINPRMRRCNKTKILIKNQVYTNGRVQFLLVGYYLNSFMKK